MCKVHFPFFELGSHLGGDFGCFVAYGGKGLQSEGIMSEIYIGHGMDSFEEYLGSYGLQTGDDVIGILSYFLGCFFI